MRDSAYCKLEHLVKVRTNLEYIGEKTCQINFSSEGIKYSFSEFRFIGILL